MRADILEKYDLMDLVNQLKPVDTIEEMENNYEVLDQIFAAVVENEPNVIPLFPYCFYLAAQYDTLGDSLGVVMGSDSTEVVNLYATEEFKRICEVAYDWMQKGYIMKDYASTNETYTSLFKSGRLFATTDAPGCLSYDNKVSAATGLELTMRTLKNPLAMTSSIVKMANTVPISATEPEAAVAFMNLLYADEDVKNLISYGVKDVHYVETGDGHIDYPAGIDSSNSKYPATQPWMYGNTMFGGIWAGEDLDRDAQAAAYEAVTVTAPTLGFMFDTSSVKNEVAACKSVVTEYSESLISGSVDPEVALPEFLEKLDKSGMNSILEEKQKQLDAWLAEKGE